MARIQEKGKQPKVEEIELNLSLSLNGKFGVDPNAKPEKKLPFLLSSSSTGVAGGGGGGGGYYAPLVPAPPLVRTCSVQVENGDEEGEIEILKKMAKRKRMERMSIVRGVRERIEGDGYGGSKGNYGNDHPLGGVVEESDEGSSPGCGSSEVSDPTGHQAIQVPSNSGEAKSASSLLPERNEQNVAVIRGMATPSVAGSDSRGTESKKKALIKAMANRGWHYVFTSLNGPNHVKVEGFLQKFGSGQPVKIICFCHGAHHSPAEFVKHGGGDAVEHPLKHIVVTLPSVS